MDSLNVTNQIKRFPKRVEALLYEDWLMEQRGVFYDYQEGSDFFISLLFKPIDLEAAQSSLIQNNEIIDLPKFVKLKKGFHYFTIQCSSKNNSVSGLDSKDKIYNELKKSLYFITGKNDTIRHFNNEFFPSSVMNQPNVMIILIPDGEVNGAIQAGIRGSSFHVNDLKINVSKEALQNLPEIKV